MSVRVLGDDADRRARAVEIACEYAERKQAPEKTAPGGVRRCRSCDETVDVRFTAC